jgi:hypothetical protein
LALDIKLRKKSLSEHFDGRAARSNHRAFNRGAGIQAGLITKTCLLTALPVAGGIYWNTSLDKPRC